MFKVLITLIFSIAMVGCASYGTKIDSSAIAKIQKGVTTEAELLQLLGRPMSVGATPDGRKLMMYVYSESQVKATTFIPVVGVLAGGADTSTQTLQVWIDETGVVSTYAYNTSGSEVNTGLLVQ